MERTGRRELEEEHWKKGDGEKNMEPEEGDRKEVDGGNEGDGRKEGHGGKERRERE